jgi:hypothetical protein
MDEDISESDSEDNVWTSEEGSNRYLHDEKFVSFKYNAD